MIKNKNLVFIFLILAIITYSCKSSKEITKTKSYHKQEELSRLYLDAFHLNLLSHVDEAVVVYQKIAQSDSKHSASRYELARIFASNNKFPEAIKYAKEALAIDPDNRWYELLLIDIYERTGNRKMQIQHYESLLKKFPNDLSIYYGLANAHLQSNNAKSAIEVLNKIESLIGINEEVSIQKYQLFLQSGNKNAAVNELKKLTEFFPDVIDYRIAVGSFYIQTGNFYEAISHFEAAKEIEPANVEVLISLAESYMRLGNFAKSTQYFKQIFEDDLVVLEAKMEIMLFFYEISESDKELQLAANELLAILISRYPNDAKVYSLSGDFYYRNGEYKEALKSWQKVLEIDDSRFPVWEFVLHTLSLLDETDKLLEMSVQSQKLFPEQAKTYFYKGIALYSKNNNIESAEAFEMAISMDPDNKFLVINSLVTLGQLYHRLEMDSLLFDAYEKVLKMDKNNVSALNNYAYYLAEREKNLDQALSMSSQAIKISPNTDFILDTHAWVLYKKGEYQKAEQYILKAIKSSTEEKSIYFEHYAEILIKLNKQDEAIEYLNKAIKMGGNEEVLNERINSIKK